MCRLTLFISFEVFLKGLLRTPFKKNTVAIRSRLRIKCKKLAKKSLKIFPQKVGSRRLQGILDIGLDEERNTMTMQLIIPDPVLEALRIPNQHVEQELLKELAIALYDREILPFSKAAELAQMDKQEFSRIAAHRDISRRCTVTDVNGRPVYTCSE